MHETIQVSGTGHQGSSRHYLASPVPFGEIDWAMPEYREFVCSKSTASWLQAGGMTHIDGKRVVLQIKDECVGGHNVIMGFWVQDDPSC